MQNSEFPNTRVSPCLKFFIASLLENADRELIDEALLLADGKFAVSAALASVSQAASDENYN